MSIISKLGEKFSNLPVILEEYDKIYDDVSTNLSVTGKTLERTLKEQCSWPVYYDSRKVELKILVKYIEMQECKIRGMLVKKYKEHYSRDLGERQLNSYIDQEPEYITIHELLLECEELYDKFCGIGDSFTKRGFALRDITQSRIHTIQDGLL